MKQVLLNPIVLFLLLAVGMVAGAISIFATTDNKKLRMALDKVFAGILLIVTSPAIVFPFSYLNPSSLAIATIKITSVTSIAQFLFYPFVFFLLRSKFRSLYSIINVLIKDPFLCLLLLMTIISTFWSATPDVTLKSGVLLLMISIIAASVGLRYDFQEIAKILRWTGTWITGLGTLASILAPSIARADEGNWNGILAHKNVFAFWIALTASLWFFHAIYHRETRWRAIGISLTCLIVMIFAGSGMAKIMFLVMIGVLSIFHVLRKIDFRKVLTTLIITIVIAIPSLLWALMNKQFIFASLGKDATLTGRTDFWPQVIDAIWERPLVGYGYQGFWQDWRGKDNPAAHIINHNGFVPPHSHSGYLEILLALGIVGLILFAFSLINNIVKLFACMPYSKHNEFEIAVLLLIFILMSNFSEAGLWGITHYTFLYVFLTVRLQIDSTRFKRNRSLDSLDRDR
jgi:exopolysaccharide production protein ExoQ